MTFLAQPFVTKTESDEMTVAAIATAVCRPREPLPVGQVLPSTLQYLRDLSAVTDDQCFFTAMGEVIRRRTHGLA